MKRLLLCAILSTAALAQSPSLKDAFASLPFRNIGPANPGGRVDDIAVVESDPRITYVGTAAGGVFKTENGGVTFTPLSQTFPDLHTRNAGAAGRAFAKPEPAPSA